MNMTALGPVRGRIVEGVETPTDACVFMLIIMSTLQGCVQWRITQCSMARQRPVYIIMLSNMKKSLQKVCAFTTEVGVDWCDRQCVCVCSTGIHTDLVCVCVCVCVWLVSLTTTVCVCERV